MSDHREETRVLIPFEQVAGNPQAWQDAAHDLIHAAGILLEAYREGETTEAPERRPPMWRTILMLYGLAAENLIKAIIVAKGPNPASEGKLPHWFTRHNLERLAGQRARLHLAKSHAHLLNRLQAFVECGKYPVGIREGEGRTSFVFSEPIDINDTLQLLEYLDEELARASGGFAPASLDLRHLRVPFGDGLM